MEMERQYPFFCAEATLGSGEASHTVQAAPGAGKILVVTAYHFQNLISHANGVDLEDSGGTTEILKVPGGAGLVNYASPKFAVGKKLTAGQALVLTAVGGAGPSAHVLVEGYTMPGA